MAALPDDVSSSSSTINSSTRLVTLTDILKAENYSLQAGDYIQVIVVWQSNLKDDSTRCPFILADENDHIAALLWLDDYNAENIVTLLKENTIWQISNFQISDIGSNTDSWRLLRGQNKQLKLSCRSGNYVSTCVNNLLSYIPFKFTPLEELDKCPQESFVDIIAFVAEIEKEKTARESKVQYETVLFSTSRSQQRGKGFKKQMAIFGNKKKQITRKQSVYALMNVKVKDWNGHKSLQTVSNTVILKITEDNMKEKLPREYLEQKFVMDLFPKKRGSKSNATQARPKPGTSKRANGSESANEISPTKSRRISQPNEGDIESKIPLKTYDFENSYTPLKVNVIKCEQYMDGIGSYRMRSKPRGIALIINNNHFPEREEPVRDGSTYDAKNLRAFLTDCKFEIQEEYDLTSESLARVVTSFKKRATPDMDACFVALLSHAEYMKVEMTDGKHIDLLQDFIYQFGELNFPEMAGKPKIFVLQMCQDFPSTLLKQPQYQNVDNMIICYSTRPGEPSFRDRYMGSHYIHILIDTFMEYAHKYDLETLLKGVQLRLRNTRIDGKHQYSTHVAYCFKTLYFNPGK